MDSNSTEFEVPRVVQKAAAFGGLVIDSYLAAHENRQARIGASQPEGKKIVGFARNELLCQRIRQGSLKW